MKLPQFCLAVALVFGLCGDVNAVGGDFQVPDASEEINTTKSSVDWFPGQFGNHDTCQNQVDYLSFTVTALTDADNVCDGCKTYRVCLTLILPLEGELIQQTCVKNGSICNPPDFHILTPLKWSSDGIGLAIGNHPNGESDAVTTNGGTQCQIGSAGSVLEFLIDDGRCWVGPTIPDYSDFAHKVILPPTQSDPAFEIICHSRKYWNEEGDLNYTIGDCCDCKEDVHGCVWRIELPNCTTPKDASPYSPSLSPSPACYCPPINLECQKEEETMEASGYEHHIEITDCKDPQGVADFVNQMGIDFYHGSFNCHVSTVPDCNNIYCESFVPEWIYSNFSTCPIPSPSPLPL